MLRTLRSASASGVLHGAVLGLVAWLATPVRAIEFHVAQTGDDAATGTAEEPFASLERARDAVRQARKQAAARSEPATVIVHPGVYALAKTFVLTQADGGTVDAQIVYRSAEPGRAILRGSVAISGFAPAAGNVLTADVKPAGLGGKPFRLLFWNGRRLEMARYPNVDPANPLETGWAFTAAEPPPADAVQRAGPRRIMQLAAADRRRWADPTAGEVSIFPSHEWWNNVLPIATVDEAAGVVELSAEGSYDIQPGDRYFVRGLREELDAPGEWQLDRKTGVVSLIPPEPIAPDAAAKAADISVRAPRLDTLVQFGPGAAHVTLRGFVLEECGGTAVCLVNADHCIVEECTIRACGDYDGDGVSIAGGHGNVVEGCDISDSGRHGIRLAGGDLQTLAPGDHVARANRIVRTGVIHKQGCGVDVAGVGNCVVRNEIRDLPRFGVMFSGANLLVEGNRIERTSLETADAAAIYGGSLDWRHGHGCIIRGNVVKDVVGRSGKAGVWKSPFFAWGIYLDWSAMGVTVEGNTVVRCPRSGIMLHDGRDNTIVDNTIVDCGYGTFENGHTSLIEASGWDTSSRYWRREIDNWCRQYDAVEDAPLWRAMKSFRDPRAVPLPDGRTMHGHVIEHNTLVWHDPDARPFRFRNVPENHSRCDHNRLWHFDAPIKTGVFGVKSVLGENLAGPNPGFEHGSPGVVPDTWTWATRPSPADTATVATDRPHAGLQCLRIEGVPDPANAAKEPWARLPGVRGPDIPVEQGAMYRLVAWLRAQDPDTPVQMGFTSEASKGPPWVELTKCVVGPEWSKHEAFVRVPVKTPAIDSLFVRFRLGTESSIVFVDGVEVHRVEPFNEWAAWQAAGWDRHSVVSDRGLAAAALAAPAHAAKKNVLMICVDDLKPLLGCYGEPLVHTPNIDRLAARGILFERAFCNQAVCAPSRNALMTGLRPTTIGIYDLETNFRKAVPEAVTVAQHFMNHGYQTHALGKIMHVGHGNTEDAVSWSTPHWRPKAPQYHLETSMSATRPADVRQKGMPTECADVPDTTYADGQIAEEAIARLRAFKETPGKPWFLGVGFMRPHLPFVAPKKYWDLYERESFPLPALKAPPAGAPEWGPHEWPELRNYLEMPAIGPLTDEQTRLLIHGYHAAISYMDAQLGRVLDALDVSGLADDTIILLWGDHGWHLGDHGMWCKHTNYEQAVRTPLIVAAPGSAKAGAKTGALVETVDIYPTLCELAGLPLPTGLDGTSFVKVLEEPSSKTRDVAFHVYPRKNLLGRAVRTERYRMVEWKVPGAPAHEAVCELYNYEEDPLETRNLAADFPEVVANLRAVLATQPEGKPQTKAKPQTK